MNEIKVSVLCATYNHEKYIRAAIDGFIKQKTDFQFEVIIHDDASTDRTSDIIKEYQKRYPDIIKPIFQKENQYSKGVKIIKDYLLPKANGEYIALCEGDDYWTDELKLQKQFDALNRHPEIDGCAHKVEIRNSETGNVLGYMAPLQYNAIIPVEKVIEGGGEFVATNSLMYRKNVWNRNYAFTEIMALDYVTQIMISLKGGLLYFDDCMGVYNNLSSGSWTSRMRNDVQQHNEHTKKVIQMLECLDIEMKYKYHKSIYRAISARQCSIVVRDGNLMGLLKEPAREYFIHLSIKAKIVYILKTIKHRQGIKKNGK